jgi:glycosyltransferase involved in cell wall biosynthesis
LAGLRGVEVLGDPPDIRPWLWNAAAFACPITAGTGMKNTLLEAMAAGAAAVATTNACRGLSARDGDQLLVADADQSLADGLVRLLRDRTLREALGDAASRYAVTHHAPKVIAAQFAALYADVAGSVGSG